MHGGAGLWVHFSEGRAWMRMAMQWVRVRMPQGLQCLAGAVCLFTLLIKS